MKRARTWRIFAWGGVGDVLLLTPALRAVKREHHAARLIVYCMTKRDKEILRHNPNIDAIKCITVVHRLLHRMGILRVMLADYARVYPSLCCKAHASRIIAEMLGVSLRDEGVEICLTSSEEIQAKENLHDLENPIAIHVTGGCTANKTWPVKKWESLVQAHREFDFFQLGLLTDDLIKGARDFRGRSLRESFALIKSAKGFVGIDSGFAHAASGLGTPAVVLFGPSTPVIWGHTSNRNLYKRFRCSPCIDILRDVPCPYGKMCMESIAAEEVGSALKEEIRSKEMLTQSVRAPLARC